MLNMEQENKFEANRATDILSALEKDQEKELRPREFHDFAGQNQVIDNLKVFVHAAMQRSEALDHVLLHGPPGLGKTTLAFIIANHIQFIAQPAIILRENSFSERQVFLSICLVFVFDIVVNNIFIHPPVRCIRYLHID